MGKTLTDNTELRVVHKTRVISALGTLLHRDRGWDSDTASHHRSSTIDYRNFPAFYQHCPLEPLKFVDETTPKPV